MAVTKPKEILTDIRTWITAISVIIGAAVVISRYVQLPEKVEKIEAEVEVHDTDINKMANSIQLFSREQRIIQRRQEKREDLMLQLLKDK